MRSKSFTRSNRFDDWILIDVILSETVKESRKGITRLKEILIWSLKGERIDDTSRRHR